MASNYVVANSYSLETLQREVSTLVAEGYIPSGGIANVVYEDSLSLEETNYVDYNSSNKYMKITFMQALYKPQTNSI